VSQQEQTRAKAWAAGIGAARRRAGLVLPEGVSVPAERLRHVLSDWALAEVAPGRLMPWLPVAYGFGVVVYFTAAHEPSWWAAIAAAVVGIATAFLARRSSVGFPLALGVAAMTAGFATGTLQARRIVHPVLGYSIASAQVTGFVEISEERERSDRIVVRVATLDAPRLHEKPERVRVAVRKGTAPAVGSFVAFKAHLSPPLQPLRPGGYDFARDMYFQQICASGRPRAEHQARLRNLRSRAMRRRASRISKPGTSL
jgi:competence protein ComEC